MASLIRTFEISERQSTELMAVGSAASAVASAAAVLAVFIGLIVGANAAAAACATLAIGAGLVLEGGAIGARFRGALKRNEEDSLTKGDVLGGLTADLATGLAGVILAILALLDVAPQSLLGTAVIVYAVGLLLGCAALVHATTVTRDGVPMPAMGTDAVMLAARGQLAAGLIALALGSAALLGTAPMDLTLIALLVIAASELASSAAVTTRTIQMLRRGT